MPAKGSMNVSGVEGGNGKTGRKGKESVMPVGHGVTAGFVFRCISCTLNKVQVQFEFYSLTVCTVIGMGIFP